MAADSSLSRSRGELLVASLETLGCGKFTRVNFTEGSVPSVQLWLVEQRLVIQSVLQDSRGCLMTVVAVKPVREAASVALFLRVNNHVEFSVLAQHGDHFVPAKLGQQMVNFSKLVLIKHADAVLVHRQQNLVTVLVSRSPAYGHAEQSDFLRGLQVSLTCLLRAHSVVSFVQTSDQGFIAACWYFDVGVDSVRGSKKHSEVVFQVAARVDFQI